MSTLSKDCNLENVRFDQIIYKHPSVNREGLYETSDWKERLIFVGKRLRIAIEMSNFDKRYLGFDGRDSGASVSRTFSHLGC